MYLSEVYIRNFRCFSESGVRVKLNKGANVIIGENNSGKTTFIDALRLVLNLGQGKRDIYFRHDDFHIDSEGIKAKEAMIELTFKDLTLEEQAVFYELLVIGQAPADSFAKLTVKFILDDKVKGLERIKVKIWGGENDSNVVSSDTFDLINYIYLGALRDVENDLKPGYGNILGKLLRKIINEENDRERIIQYLDNSNKEILKDKNITLAKSIINTNLKNIEKSLKQSINISLPDSKFERIVDNLITTINIKKRNKSVIPIHVFNNSFSKEEKNILEKYGIFKSGNVIIDLEEISDEEKSQISKDNIKRLEQHIPNKMQLTQNGLGYNNLIYMATVLGDLKERKKLETYSFSCLLIEEPEAHLHPQLQDLLFNYLSSKQQDAQVIITSHSPIITSKSNIDNIIIFNKNKEDEIFTVKIEDMMLTEEDKMDLKRYLDVTKAQLFFAKGVILVEGISEALLLPVIAKREGKDLDSLAIEVINISGVAFEPFAKLFNSENSLSRLQYKCVILTDDDRCTRDDDINRIENNELKMTDEAVKIVKDKLIHGKVSYRANKAKELIKGNLDVKLSFKTFEFELARKEKNIDILLKALEYVHPKTAKNLKDKFSKNTYDIEEKAIFIWLAVRKSKAEFAQKLANMLEKKNDNGDYIYKFETPDYIKEALNNF